jgi:hypothetical protein
MDIVKWKTNDGKVINSIDDLPQSVFGFIYLIKNLTSGKSYVGRKQVTSVTKKKFGKRKLAAMTDKRLKPYEIVSKESNWLVYNGSNETLLEDVKNGHELEKIILEFCFSKAHTTYLETKYQFLYEVIESDDYLNSNILGKFYPNIFDFKNE